MYILNGIAYANEPVAQLEVSRVKPLDDGMLLLTFNNGEKRLFDTTLLNGEIFEPLKDKDVFLSVCVEDGVVTWYDGQIDCAPEYMYEHSYLYDELPV